MTMPLWFMKFLIRTRIAGWLPSVRRLSNGGSAHLHYFSDRVLTAPIEELLDTAYTPNAIGPNVIDLNQPGPHFDAPLGPSRLNAESRWIPSSWGTSELRNAIADLYIRRDGRAVDPDQEVVVTHGASAAYAAVLDAVINPGDGIAMFDPSSPLFALGAKSRRAQIRWISTWTEEGRLRFPTAAFERAVRTAKLLVLCDPMNPTGACLSPEDLDYIAWYASAYDVLIFMDESYRHFRYEIRHRSIATIPSIQHRTLTAGSVSQGWGLGSARIGWLAGHRHLLQACALTANLSAPWVSPLCQQLAARAIGESDAALTPIQDRLRGRRDYVVDRLQAMGLEAERPSGGVYCWVAVSPLGLDGRTFAQRLLHEHQVLVRPGCVFGPSGDGWVRISFAVEDGRLREGLSRLAAFVNQLRNPCNPANPTEPIPSKPEHERRAVAAFSRD